MTISNKKRFKVQGINQIILTHKINEINYLA